LKIATTVKIRSGSSGVARLERVRMQGFRTGFVSAPTALRPHALHALHTLLLRQWLEAVAKSATEYIRYGLQTKFIPA